MQWSKMNPPQYPFSSISLDYNVPYRSPLLINNKQHGQVKNVQAFRYLIKLQTDNKNNQWCNHSRSYTTEDNNEGEDQSLLGHQHPYRSSKDANFNSKFCHPHNSHHPNSLNKE